MSCLLNGNTIEYWAVKQTGPCAGVPVTPAWTNLRRIDGSISSQITTEKSNEVDPTRQAGRNVITQKSIEGSFNGELPVADDGLKLIIESAFQSEFSADLGISADTISFVNSTSTISDSANGFGSVVEGSFIGVGGTTGGTNDGLYLVTEVTDPGNIVVSPAPADESAGSTVVITGQNIRNSNSQQGLSIQKRTTHEGGVEYLTFSDCQVNTLSFAITSASLLTTTYAVLGRTPESGTDQISGSTDNDVSTAQIIGSVSGVPEIWMDGVQSDSSALLYTDMTIDIDNGGSQNYAIGGSGSAGISFEAITVSGTLNSYVDQTDATTLAAERTKADNATLFDIAIVLKDANDNRMVIRRPSTMYTSFDQPESGNGTVVQNTGSVDSEGKTNGYTIQIDYIVNPNA